MRLSVDGKSIKNPPKAKTVAELISALGLSEEEVLVKINGKLSPNSASISGEDEVKVMRVIFGG
ncbi:MAG: MoaD/ThiS family protein [Candidatus Micrarchaeota archaeon]|nr:MoaD/ThiS family protein [Candidatus Micrarchaeota archaeon]